MPRRWLRRRLPEPAECLRRLGLHGLPADERGRVHAWLVRLLDDPRPWSLNRRSVSGAVAVGLFVGWLPVPGQMMLAALLAALLRVHVPLSVVLVWFSNPLTLAPLGYLAWRAGSMVLGTPGPAPGTVEGGSLLSLVTGLGDAWPALLVGCLFCGACSAVAGFAAAEIAWRTLAVRRWRARPHALGRTRTRPAD